jgi:hypothetical protein
MEKLGLLFDARQFAAVFGAATRDSSSAVTEAQRDATVWLEDETGALEAGYTRRRGRINYQGRNYAFILSGLSIADAEGASIVASGIVMRLGKLSDFNGTYSASGRGTTGAESTPATYLTNEHGVVIKLMAADGAMSFNLSPYGVRMRIEGQR